MAASTGYLRALGTQAGEDFAWVDMLWANPSPRAIAFALYDSFLLPFANPAAGAVMLAIAALGLLRMLFLDRRAFGLVLIAFAPYALFHLLFQETANLRYATPLVVPIASPPRSSRARSKPRSRDPAGGCSSPRRSWSCCWRPECVPAAAAVRVAVRGIPIMAGVRLRSRGASGVPGD